MTKNEIYLQQLTLLELNSDLLKLKGEIMFNKYFGIATEGKEELDPKTLDHVIEFIKHKINNLK